MKKYYSIIAITFCLLNSPFVDATVENSIIPFMEQHEFVENLYLSEQKFTKNQFNEISSALKRQGEKIRLMTYNMLFDLYDHNLDEENRWPNRLPRIVELIREIQPEIIATQELYPNQIEDLVPLINDTYTFFTGQKDPDGESFGIFYNKDRFELVDSSAKNPLSMVHLRDQKTGKQLLVFNTHMPFSNIEKRELHARLIAEIVEPFAQELPTIFAGDINSFPNRMDLERLPFFDGDYILRILTSGSLKNAREQSLLGHFGPISTFTSDGKSADYNPFKGTGVPGVILDHIFVSDKVTVLTHAVEPATVDQHFPSDHMPVLIDFFID